MPSSTQQEVDDSEVPPPPVETEGDDLVYFSSGKALSEEATTELATALPVRMVVLAGSVDSGKTTLLVSLYELFQQGAIGDYIFAGSKTLNAFEQRSFYARYASGNTIPKTQRTPFSENAEADYLHLRVASRRTPHEITEFVFPDVSGEMFDLARNSSAGCQELTFLRRATDLLVFLDCQKCVDPNERYTVVQQAKSLLRSCLDSNMLGEFCAVNIIWSKYDYFESSPNKEVELQFQETIETQFTSDFGPRLPQLKFSTIAVRPLTAPQLHYGMGAEALLSGWMTFCERNRELNILPLVGSGERESEKFLERHFSNENPT